MPVAARFTYAQSGVDPLALLAVRFSVGALFLWLFRGHGEPALPLRREWPWLALTLVGLVATSGAYFLALKVIPAATAILLIYTYPAFTALFARLFFREPLGLRRGAALILVFAGSAALLGLSSIGRRALPIGGLVLALGGGLTYAAYGLGGQQLMRFRSAGWVSRWVVTGAALSFLAALSPRTLSGGGRGLLLGGLYLGFVATFLANTIFLRAIRLVGATRAGLYSTMEMVFTATLAWAILGESLSAAQLAGGALVLLGVLGLEGLD